MTNEKNAPERVWVHPDSLKNPKATYFVARNEKFKGIEYVPATALEALREENARLREALRDASLEFERISTLRDQVQPKATSSTHALEKQIAKGAEAFALAAKTEISRVLSIGRDVAPAAPNGEREAKDE